MATHLAWQDIALRLALTVFAGALVGINRDEQGRPAGLRTTLLVCLAASLAMIQTNLLLATVGKPPDSFVNIDVLRLPLGILSGIGFLGGGVILKRGNLVVGVTTAATLWFVTVMGLCFGGGQLGLGLTALALCMMVLWGLKWVEVRFPKERRSSLILTIGPDGPTVRDLADTINVPGCRLRTLGMSYDARASRREVRCELSWEDRRDGVEVPPFLEALVERPGILKFVWKP